MRRIVLHEATNNVREKLKCLTENYIKLHEKTLENALKYRTNIVQHRISRNFVDDLKFTITGNGSYESFLPF